MKVSIITPCYNSEEYLAECIRSVMSQTYSDFEHIIVDGKSSDSTIEIIKRFDGKYNMKWISEKDGGMYDAIRKGFEMATGDICCWLNSDDIYYPWTLQTVVNAFEQNPQVKWITGIPTNLNSMGQMYSPTGYKPKYYSRKAIRKGCHHGKGHGFIQQESTFWRRELWDTCGGLNREMKYAGDFDLWRRFAEHETLYSVNSVLASFRIHEGQKSGDTIAYYKEIKQYCTWRAFAYWCFDKVLHIGKLYTLANRKNAVNAVSYNKKTITGNGAGVKKYIKEILMK